MTIKAEPTQLVRLTTRQATTKAVLPEASSIDSTTLNATPTAYKDKAKNPEDYISPDVSHII